VTDAVFDRWFAALWARHTRVLTFQEIRRALQALSSLYVERREKLAAAPPWRARASALPSRCSMAPSTT